MTSLAFVVRGRVQGVGFRWFTQKAARQHGLVGWVCNEADGSVRGLAHGSSEAVARFVEALGRGPKLGRVDELLTEEVSAGGGGVEASFEIR